MGIHEIAGILKPFDNSPSFIAPIPGPIWFFISENVAKNLYLKGE